MEFLRPNWNLANNIHALSTLRGGGVSVAPYASFNLGAHVGDSPSAVAANRTLLLEKAQLPQMPLYLNQTHSINVLRLPTTETALEADAVYTDQAGQVCLVMTADCLPVLFATEGGNEVAAAHAGWRGLCDGILENTVAQFHAKPSQIVAWLAPAISQSAFQVGAEVRSAFMQHDPQAALAFQPDLTTPEKYLADLYLLARQRLKKCGIHLIYGGEYCTFSQKERFFSYRRDGVTGRMASLIWFEENN
ncbi:peptidoglycan editing factor PgeF [Testudinibacter sp. TR-2022]|uniref:peptidoglycan editing factor PgeF n=1 Tax=Testudinibacter sp. TR-2022 TaxID=2585029 RepID=UPI001118C42C|nr:peptidoglycan editing factor PgeF [Testudinibacter sp. TR-2022]TNH04992.1 peptidoglycan editing factor PgeF [Pasteurellaceae bacterium Phil31]TNH05273.1 peptidoglycan editing factor PgeF [Testudinibacter sp. TR-2022]TNH10547.1 peptidoglycan editing factor PgeF [Testudinibacter sp. TR-2022]TNH13502.1 peptidoglycan editing factor PgeF [Testudinibacter sp. TR-2022]TNH19129.1 peptidoglycan editing factor PgeF [Testudinibacter sp. TR-2022]